MVSGKARTAAIRSRTQARFDQALIEDYLGGEPLDPFDRRAIRIVCGASRLTQNMGTRGNDRCGRASPLAGGFQPVSPAEDDSGVWMAADMEVAQPAAMKQLLLPMFDAPDSVLLPYPIASPTCGTPPTNHQQRCQEPFVGSTLWPFQAKGPGPPCGGRDSAGLSSSSGSLPAGC